MENLVDSIDAGINLKPQHYQQALIDNSKGLWFEVHTENYLVNGGPRLHYLEKFAEKFPISFHGVGASLGNPTKEFQDHLKKIASLVKKFNPLLISEHATWSGINHQYYADLLPLPKTEVVLQQLCEGVDAYQNAIGRTIAIENPSNYMSFTSEMDEVDFLMEVSKRSGCDLLIDVNNLFISANNCGLDAKAYLQKLKKNKVVELHIAGFDYDPKHQKLLIDSHSSAVSDSVWELLRFALNTLGHKPVLLERDGNIPEYHILRNERQKAQEILEDSTQSPELKKSLAK